MSGNEFGEVTFMGITFVLETVPDYTSSAIPNGYNTVDEGEEYQTEIAAPAHSINGKRAWIVWRFWVIKGSEPQLDEYDYGDVYEVHAL